MPPGPYESWSSFPLPTEKSSKTTKICCRTWLSHTKLLHWSGLISESQEGSEIWVESAVRKKSTPGVHSTHVFPHWTQVKYRQITGKSSRFLYAKHISLTVVFVVIPDVDQNGLSNVPDYKPENKVLMTWVTKSPTILFSPNTWPL